MNYLYVVGGKVENLIVADPEWVEQQENAYSYIKNEDAKGFVTIGSELHIDGFFYEPQPHPQWVRNGDGSWRPPLEKPNQWQHMTIAGHFGKTEEQIYTFYNIVNPEIAAAIVEYAESVEEWSEETGINANRIDPVDIKGRISANSLNPPDQPVYEVISGIIEDVTLIVEKTFNVKVSRPLPVITRMGPGAVQGEHYDKLINQHYIFNDPPVPDRDLTAVIYYNENFTGGELKFPQHDLVFTPKTGMIIMYPGDMYHSHEVNEVMGGVRYTSPLFFSINELL
jgi:hypothetical protein